ncbi:MAG: hypothetical protein AB1752_13905 [Candidatus Zixiibacteriota bacterium]
MKKLKVDHVLILGLMVMGVVSYFAINSRSMPTENIEPAVYATLRTDSTTQRIEDSTNVSLQVSRAEFDRLRAQVDSLKSLVLWIGGR